MNTTMVTGGGQDGRSAGRPRHGRASSRQWPRLDRKRVLAVTLSLVTLLSVLVVPVAGAGSSGGGALASVDDASGTAQPVAENQQNAGKGNGNGGGNGGSSGGSGGDGGSDDEEDDSDDGDESSGNGGGQAKGSGNGQANGNGNGQGKGNGNGQANRKGPPSTVEIDVGPVGPGAGGPGKSNAGGNGPPGKSNAGGSGEGGPPAHAKGGAGNGPSVSVASEPPGLERAQAASGGPAPSSVVSVSVRNARAGDRVELDVSTESAADDAVAFDGISVTVKRDGDFTMRVTNSREALSGSPAFEPDQAADALGRVRLDHSITNEEVEEVSYTFRVSKAHLRSTDTDPEDVALFRHAGGEWSELPTDVVGETRTHYLLSSDSPGMSEFAIGAKRPDFDTFWADVETGSVEAGETLTVRGRVTNDGGADGVFDARLVVDGETVAERSITIAAGGTRQINFQTTLDRAGSRRVSINQVSAGEVDVVEAASTADGERSSDTTLSVVIDRLLDVGRAIGVVSSS